jgi:Gpi18-like mannosyltransferase
VILLILPFAVNQEPSWIFKLYVNTAEGYKYASLNAFNFFSLIGANLKTGFRKTIVCQLSSLGLLLYCCNADFYGSHVPERKGPAFNVHIRPGSFHGSVHVSIRMHERYMFPVMFFLAVLFIVTRDKWGLAFYGACFLYNLCKYLCGFGPNDKRQLSSCFAG